MVSTILVVVGENCRNKDLGVAYIYNDQGKTGKDF